jgi:hypothetical protein
MKSSNLAVRIETLEEQPEPTVLPTLQAGGTGPRDPGKARIRARSRARRGVEISGRDFALFRVC